MADQIANLIDDQEIADAYITLCVHAGIAASDVICCKKLGTHNQGSSHINAVALLARADRRSSELLRSLLAMKTRSGYSPALSSEPDMVRAGRAALALVIAAELI